MQEQTDLIVANPVYDQAAVSYPGSKPVSLFFNHALSRIVFSGILLDPESAASGISVKSITLSGLYHSGAVDLGVSTPAWSVDPAATASYTLSTDGGELAATPLSATAATLTTDIGFLFLMPQSLTRDNGPEPTMEVTLVEEGAEDVHTSLLFSPTEWLPGKSYNYRVVVDGDDVRLVLVDVEDLSLTDWRVEVMIEPVPLTADADKDLKRLYSALASLGHLNMNEGGDIPSPDPCNYFSIYLMHNLAHDITIDMNGYESMFTDGEYVIFDAKKVLGAWGAGSGGAPWAFTVNFDPAYWTLEPARQNVANPLDATSGATATDTTSPALTNSITTYGSVIVRRNSTPSPNP